MTELAHGKERRREPRAQIARPVYVETTGPYNDRFEELRTTRDLSRWGFYFVTEKGWYRPGMSVHAIPAFGFINCEYDGEVVRVEQLSPGEFGVAIRLLCVRDPIGASNTFTRSIFDSFARADAPVRKLEDGAVHETEKSEEEESLIASTQKS
jgi:hypothetical protein